MRPIIAKGYNENRRRRAIAKGRKTGGKDFPKGVSGNPEGRPPLPPDLKEARGVNQVMFERVANKYLAMEQSKLQALTQEPTLPVLDTLVVSLIIALAKTGDYKRFDFLLNRLIGRVKTVVEISGPGGTPIEARLSKMSDEELFAYYEEHKKKVFGKK